MPAAAAQDQWEDVAPPPARAPSARQDDEWEDVGTTASAPLTPEKPGFFHTVARDVISMVKPLVGQGGTEFEDPEKFRQRFAAMTPEQQEAQRKQTRATAAALPHSDIASTEAANYQRRVGEGQSVPRALAETTYEAGGGANMTGFDEAVKQGNTAEALGHLAAPVALGAAGKVIEMAPDAAGSYQSVKDSIGNAMRTEKGTLKPGVRAVARVGGAAAGGAIGSAVGAPSGGAIVGGMAGPGVVDLLTPNRPPPPGVAPVFPEASEFYANEGAERNAILKRGENEPQSGVAPTEPSAGEFYENKAIDLINRQRAQDALDRQAARQSARAEKSKISIVSEGEGNITGPRPTGSEGRPATWTNERVQELAKQGNRDAIAQLTRRGLPLPENARYIMGDQDFPRGNLNPREVTKFTPEGTAIRDVANPLKENRSSRARIQIVGSEPGQGTPPTPQTPLNFSALPSPARSVTELERPIAAAPVGRQGEPSFSQLVNEGESIKNDFQLMADDKKWQKAVTTPGERVTSDTGEFEGVGKVIEGATDPVNGSEGKSGRVLVEHQIEGRPVQRWYRAINLGAAEQGAVGLGPQTPLPAADELETAFVNKGMDPSQANRLAKQTLREASTSDPENPSFMAQTRQVALDRIKRVMGPEMRQSAGAAPQGVERRGGVQIVSQPQVAIPETRVPQIEPNEDATIEEPESEAVDLGSATAAAKKPRAPRVREPREQLMNFDPDTLEQAKQELIAANDKWQAFEKPGRYVHNANDKIDGKPDIVAYGISSARPSIEAEHLWLKKLPKMTAGKLQAAVESGKGIEYTRLLNEAGQHIQRIREANAPVLEEMRGELESAAQNVESVDPDLAQTLRDVAAGKYSAALKFAEFAKGKLNEAESATAFAKAIDAAAEGSTEDVSESSAENPPENQGNQQAIELGILPGMQRAVAENRASAAVELGRRLSDKINEPRSVESAAGEMEQKSPLFRGTAASPQNEMFSAQSQQNPYIARWSERLARAQGDPAKESKVIADARAHAGSLSLQRNFGESSESFDARNPQIAEFSRWVANLP